MMPYLAYEVALVLRPASGKLEYFIAGAWALSAMLDVPCRRSQSLEKSRSTASRGTATPHLSEEGPKTLSCRSPTRRLSAVLSSMQTVIDAQMSTGSGGR